MDQPDGDAEQHSPQPRVRSPKPVLPYQSEELFPRPPEADAFRFLGSCAIALALVGWSVLIGLALTRGISSAGTLRPIGSCTGGLAWLISVTLAIGVAWRREIRGLIALLLDLLLIVGCRMWNLFN